MMIQIVVVSFTLYVTCGVAIWKVFALLKFYKNTKLSFAEYQQQYDLSATYAVS